MSKRYYRDENTNARIDTNTETNKRYRLKKIKLSKIKIPKEFKMYYPNQEKIYHKYIYFKKFERFDSYIYLDKDNTLTDGYITYLLARMFGIKEIYTFKETNF